MALKLIYEKRRGDQSPFAPYIAVLPRVFTTPLCFSDDEVEELQWPPLVEDVNIERNYFAHEWSRLCDAMQDPPSKEELFWALSCAGTRSFTADFGGDGEDGELMCPIADMVNHDYRAKPAFRWNPESGQFELFAPVPYRRGEQVCISYGDVNNEHLLHYYGFIPAVNGFDHFTVKEQDLFVALPQEEQTDKTLMTSRMKVLKLLMQGGAPFLSSPLRELAPTSFVVDVTSPHHPDNNTCPVQPDLPEDHAHRLALACRDCLARRVTLALASCVRGQEDGSDIRVFPGAKGADQALMYARALTLTADDVQRGEQQAAKKVQGGRVLCRESEQRAKALLAGVLHAQQESMPTTLQEDTALLQAAESGQLAWAGNMDHYTLALRYRVGRKKMVADVLNKLGA